MYDFKMQSQFNKKVSKLPVKLCGSIKQAFREQHLHDYRCPKHPKSCHDSPLNLTYSDPVLN